MKAGPRSRVRKRNTRLRVEDAVIVVAPPPPSERASVGIPPLILAAAVRYAEWRDGLRDSSLSEDAMHEVMLARAQQAGGVLEPGETINLSSWSGRTGIPQAVLEALVLAGHRRSAAPPPPPPSVRPLLVPQEGDDGPWTPSPQAHRQPFVADPPSSHHLY
jgi:hypothetical protein